MNDLASVFKALSDETRLKVIKLLEHGELCVCDITAALDMSQPKISFHLGVLKNAGLLKNRKAGKWMHYALDDSDYLKRLLTLSVIQGVSDDTLRTDRERLETFLRNRKNDQQATKTCCARNTV
ncbi:MAG: metalloregulator ArsR/SmtB family transcription factor [Syntrophorhabdaceae bacterium]|nr:metalloregulator ArsR/SmtB family transcription factor [Syntrophorhabdaceae bacterium]HOC45489.1 metalloregulator ArsR/SmtB family transcription factor [Syntrophorhabdaceae bacterium]